MDAGRDAAPRRVRAIPSGGRAPRPTWPSSPMATALGDVRDLGVGAGSPSSRAGGSTSSRANAASQPARRHLRGGARRRPAHPLPHLHRQRRRRTGARPPHPRAGRARASPTRARTSGSCATRRCRLDLLGTWVRERRSCRSSGRCASSPASRPTCSASSTAATCARARGPTSCVFDPETVAPGPTAAGARLPGRRRAPHRRGARRAASRARQRHAHPPRRGAARRSRPASGDATRDGMTR